MTRSQSSVELRPVFGVGIVKISTYVLPWITHRKRKVEICNCCRKQVSIGLLDWLILKIINNNIRLIPERPFCYRTKRHEHQRSQEISFTLTLQQINYQIEQSVLICQLLGLHAKLPPNLSRLSRNIWASSWVEIKSSFQFIQNLRL